MVTAAMLGRAKAQAEAEAAGLLAGGTKSKGAARAARYASSPSYFTPMPLIGKAGEVTMPLIDAAGIAPDTRTEPARASVPATPRNGHPEDRILAAHAS